MEPTEQNSLWVSANLVFSFKKKKKWEQRHVFSNDSCEWPGFLPHTLKAHQEISSTGSPAHLTAGLQLLATYTQHFLGNPLCF